MYQLRPTRLPNRSEGQFVKAVGGWVKLFNDALSNGNLPEAMSWLGKMYESDNNTSVDEAFDKFQVCTPSDEEQRSPTLKPVANKTAVGCRKNKNAYHTFESTSIWPIFNGWL